MDKISIIGINVAADGLKELNCFFKNMPSGKEVAVVIIQPLSLNSRSILVGDFTPPTEMSVSQIQDNTKIEAGKVYITPPNHLLSLVKERFILSPISANHGMLLPAEVFFRSLKENLNKKAVAVILASNNSDGAFELNELKEAGSLTIIQQHDTEDDNGKPKSVNKIGPPDYIIPVKEMPKAIFNYFNNEFKDDELFTADDELEKYKEHLEQLKRVQEAGKVGYWAVYVENEFLEWSSETYKLFDLPIDKPITYADMLTYVFPDDKDWVYKMWQKAMKNGKYAVVYRITSATQKIKWIETYGDVVFDAAGNFLRALGIVRDITEQKEVEIKLASLASSLKRSQKIGNLGSWVVSATSPYIDINEEAQIMFGWPMDQPMTVDNWLTAIHPDDRNRVWQCWTSATNGEEIYDVEYRIIINSSIKWIKAVAEIEFNSNREFVRGVGVIKDITEHIKQQEELRIAKEQAEAATKLKSTFLANMSHEIRTPLNGVIGFSELLMKTHLNETQKEYMTTVNQSAHGLIGIINDILDFSKMEAGKLELLEEKVDLSELSKQAKNIISYQPQKKNIDVLVKIESNVPQYVIADGLRLQQVLSNLMSNAIKFTDEGEIELSIKLLNGDPQKVSLLRFAVRDTGIGISSENQSKIFEAFTQEDSSTTKKFGGTGLGLSICNGILALMKSRLQLKAEIDKGSLFYFDIALKSYSDKENNSDISTSNNIHQGNISIESSLESMTLKVLIVEDNLINIKLFRILTKQILSKVEISEAHDGEEAIELFEKEKPDLILMDIQMPIMNGYDATRRIREIESTLVSNQRTPIVALTAGTLESNKEKCFAAGMDDFLSKPIINETFKSIVKKWVLK